MSNSEKNNSMLLNLALVIAVGAFAVLVMYSNHFRKKQTQTTEIAQKESTTQVAATKTAVATPSPMNGERSPLTLASTSGDPLANAIHPKKTTVIVTNTTPEVPESDAEIKTILAKQSIELRAERASQGLRPEDKRALSLSEKEIQELEKSGRMIY